MPRHPDSPLTARRAGFQRALREWYHHEARPLPWRESPTLYKTVVSEFMLQQTQVKTVLPYFARWLETLPDFQTLAAAPEAQVLKLWEGLGYYSRARNLHRLAQAIAAMPAPPRDAAAWRELPGVGLIWAATLLAYLDTPFRFKTSRQLWKYCGLGLRRMASGTDKRGQPRPGYLQLHRGCNHLLKSVIVGATLSAIRQRKNIFYHYCPVTT